jgi:ectoine hydroxylase-related dioxygenase (phytanoyl-CoA dioxygenase family)
MGKVLSEQQIKAYVEQGFVSPIDVLSEDEAAQYLHRLEEAEAQYPEWVNPHKRNNVHLSFKCLDELAHHPRVLDAVEDILGSHFSLWGTVLFCKDPESPHYVSWHQDATYMGMSGHTFVTPWLALTDSNIKTGCMQMIPGSHRGEILKHEDTYGEYNILTRGQQVIEVDETEAVDMILKPGQMSLHHAKVIHGSRPNQSSERRVGFAMQSFMPPEVEQVIGKNLWLDARGHNPRKNNRVLRRPAYDLDPVAMSDRALADTNMDDILYRGAAQKRNF